MQARTCVTVRNGATAIAALCVAGCLAATSAAQTASSTPGQTPGLQGTGPRVDVQNSANGTLDVGGAAGTDLNMVGENFRGSFGASRLQPFGSATPNLPRSSVQAPFAAPNFGPSMPGSGALNDAPRGQTAEATAYPDLILPRFRGVLGGSPQRQSPDAWRYRYSGGRWWFWQPTGDWVYWDGARWQSFVPRQ